MLVYQSVHPTKKTLGSQKITTTGTRPSWTNPRWTSQLHRESASRRDMKVGEIQGLPGGVFRGPKNTAKPEKSEKKKTRIHGDGRRVYLYYMNFVNLLWVFM